MENLKYLTVVAYANAYLLKILIWPFAMELFILSTLLLNVYLGIKVAKNVYLTFKNY